MLCPYNTSTFSNKENDRSAVLVDCRCFHLSACNKSEKFLKSLHKTKIIGKSNWLTFCRVLGHTLCFLNAANTKLLPIKITIPLWDFESGCKAKAASMYASTRNTPCGWKCSFLPLVPLRYPSRWYNFSLSSTAATVALVQRKLGMNCHDVRSG